MSTTLRSDAIEIGNNSTNMVPPTPNNSENASLSNTKSANGSLVLPAINFKATNPNASASVISLSSKNNSKPTNARQLSTSSYHNYAPLTHQEDHEHGEHIEMANAKPNEIVMETTNNANTAKSAVETAIPIDEEKQRVLAALIRSTTAEQLEQRQPGDRKPFHQKIYKTPKETAAALQTAAKNKSEMSWDKIALSSFISGVFIAYGGIFALTVYTGSPSLDAGMKKLYFGLTFEVALVFIVLFGTELFTGNTMTMTIGWLTRTITWKDWTKSLTITWFCNFIGCLFGVFFFAYFTELFTTDPFLSGVTHIAEVKCALKPHVVFLRAIAANWLVCLAVFMASAAESVEGKILACLIPVATFAASSFEHTIANMFFIPLGLLLGAQTDVATFIGHNLILSTLGNFVGGALFMGCVTWWLYLRNAPVKPPVTKGTLSESRSTPLKLD